MALIKGGACPTELVYPAVCVFSSKRNKHFVEISTVQLYRFKRCLQMDRQRKLNNWVPFSLIENERLKIRSINIVFILYVYLDIE